MKLTRTDSSHSDFAGLVNKLDAELAVIDGDEHAFYAQYNGIDMIRHAVVVYDGEKAVACGAIKPLGNASVEVKRMYTLPEERGKGYASASLRELESWAAELGYGSCMLETGIRQPDAIALYTKSGYQRIPNYGQYAGVENSVCFEKRID